ncbi:hypothetical protein BC829DRAFT_119325 [Chytridium lagenaria]|nr:hypothetical protein BC829DRAFT_119325 [Chytridium lagenaria]
MMHRQLGRMDRSASNAMLKLAETVSGTNPNLSLAASNPPASPQFDNISSTSSPNERIRSVLQFEDCFWGNGEDPTVGVKTLYDLISKHLNEVEEMIVAVKQRIAIEEGYAMRMADFAKVLQTFTLASGFIGASTHTGMGFGNAVPYGGIGGLGSASAWVDRVLITLLLLHPLPQLKHRLSTVLQEEAVERFLKEPQILLVRMETRTVRHPRVVGSITL